MEKEGKQALLQFVNSQPLVQPQIHPNSGHVIKTLTGDPNTTGEYKSAATYIVRADTNPNFYPLVPRPAPPLPPPILKTDAASFINRTHSCTVISCKNPNGITYHTFPRDKERAKKWLEKCGRPPSYESYNKKICAIHFTEDDYDPELTEKRTLKPDAVPSLNLKVVGKMKGCCVIVSLILPICKNCKNPKMIIDYFVI